MAMAVCPEGWHLPSIEDWDFLMDYVETDNGNDYYPDRRASDIAGKYLKATKGWSSSSLGGSQSEDKYGFAAIPGGYGYYNDDNAFRNIEFSGRWWFSTERTSESAYHVRMEHQTNYVQWREDDKGYLYSVRCVQNGSNPIIPSKGNDIANYKTVKIGEQTWMAENLDYAVEGSKCYRDRPAQCAIYGRLYNWETAKTVCPAGWHLPSDSDWDILMNYVETDNGSAYVSGDHASITGKYLKATSGWKWDEEREISGNGEDKYGFAALPGGYGNYNLNYSYNEVWFGFGDIDGYGFWWSSSEGESDTYASICGMNYNDDRAMRYGLYKENLHSVRCVQD
jgi:uncharacterized protein (TIGR02145 family)